MTTDGPTLRDLADAIWLATALGSGPPPAGSRDLGAAPPPPDPAHQRRSDADLARPASPGGDSRSREERWRSTSASPAPAPTDNDSLGRRTIDARVARDRPLPHRERIARALRPLRRSVVAGTGLTVDEPATAQHLAAVGTMTPVFQPLRERWLELAIVIDSGCTMRLWQETGRAVRSLAERRGAFRDVRTYRLNSDVEQADLVDDGGNPHHFRELSDHAGRRLILLLTDGVGPVWRTAAAQAMLAGWAHRNPVAIVQVLPPSIWHRTALPPATVMLRSAAPGRIGLAGPGRAAGPWIPVVPLRAAPLEAWARLLAGHELNGIAMPAVPVGRLPAATITADPAAATTPREQVVRFQSAASPTAFALAGRLAAAPLTLPLMRAIQNVLHPESDLGHLAEILLSGLLVQIPAAGRDEDVQYEFWPGIREELLRTRSRRDAYSVLETLRDIAPFVPNPYGSLDVWALSAEPGSELGEHRQGRRFAEVAITVLGGLGGHYADMADRIESSLTGTQRTFTSPRTTELKTDVLISYAATDRPWADWIRRQLADAGLRTALHEVSADPRLASVDRALVLLSADYVSSPEAASLWRQMSAGIRVLSVRLDATRLTPPFTERIPVDLVGQSAERAYEALLTAFDRQPDPDWQDPHDPRFPAVRPPVWNVPQRNPAFAGRRAFLGQLHARLSENVPLVLYGLGGAGKTQLAIEYAHRFAAYYDVVWWITAEQVSQVRVALVDLARELGLPESGTIPKMVSTVLTALEHGLPYKRWLLIFDIASDPEAIRAYIPVGTGHVLVTSRDREWAGTAHVEEISTFTRKESTAFLKRRVSNLRVADADTIANALGDLPLAIEQAAAWLSETGMPVSQYLELLETQTVRILDENPPIGYERTTASTWELSLHQLRERTPAAAKLLETCAFFGPEVIPVRLLQSRRFGQALLPHDAIRLGKLLRELGRFSLASIDSGQTTVAIHRLVQAVIRDTLPEDEAQENRRRVHLVLAEAERTDPDEVTGWSGYARLVPHVRASHANSSSDPPVRQLVLEVVRYLWNRGDFSSSRELARATAEIWRATSDIGEDQLTLLLDVHLANALRSQVMFEHALEIDSRALERLKEQDDPQVVMAAGGLAADLRALGRYEEALPLAEETYARARRTFGDEHDRTLHAANDLAASLRMVGDFRRAFEYDDDALARRLRIFGETHLNTLLALNSFGHDLRDLGRYEESHELLTTTLESYRTLLGDSAPATLRAATNLAMTLRKLGRFRDARQLTRDTLPRLRDLHGKGHPDTLACLMNSALEESALGDSDEARYLAQEVVDGYGRLFNDWHPLRIAALNNLATMTPDLAQEAYERFRQVLGANHPFTLASQVNLANAVFDAGDIKAARELDAETLALSREVLGERHPNTVALLEGRRIGWDISVLPT